MNNKITEKLSKRLQRLFLTHIKKYDVIYFPNELRYSCGDWERVAPIVFADYLVERVIEMTKEANGKIE